MTYSAEILADSPRFYLRLGETSGTVAEDASPNNIDGEYQGAPVSTTGLITADSDFAMNADGVDDLVLVMDSLDVTNYTIEAWISPNDVTDRTIIMRTDADPTNDFSHELFLTATGVLEHRSYDGGVKSATGTTVLTPGKTYHCVGVCESGNRLLVYLNGALEAAGPGGSFGTPWAGGDRWFIGRGHAGTGYFDGVVDEGAVYPSALSPQRIVAHYVAGLQEGGGGGIQSLYRSHGRHCSHRS